ncbi:putative DEAD-box ATP-dependent RNA helicase 48 [Morus notabilis]|uniref:ATP-dependent RNA helicase n=1 Tax=Morus notabilis TaxID=981085 RepID=W9QSB0_9ROSA|nr:probable DEAD-box ATP-dependent RNA helicase 48 [Morus notabilis]EXB37388.1 putative DEAD-box ATP-dependent RNA helicase 48 [Morus notabilis]
MSSSILLKRRNHLPKLLSTLVLTRPMGGGPRTFPGGLNKWQWKRMHEKRARDKERSLLRQEMELYQARIRSQIRANVAGKPDPFTGTGTGPMSPESHVKALADRFMKEGAEDLWNERDGPIKSPPPPKPNEPRRSVPKAESSFDLRNAFLEGCNSASNRGIGNVNTSNLSGNRVRARHYSVQSWRNGRNEGSALAANRESSKLERNSSNPSASRKISGKKQRRYFRHGDSSSDFDSESDSEDINSPTYDVKKMGSRASLGKYDVKIIKRRIPLNSLEKEIDFSEQIESIRFEINRKKLLQGEEDEDKEEESVLSEKRFDEFDISPLTIKALKSAGYVRMTRVQEAALSVVLDGNDALVKAKAGTGKTVSFLLPAIETVLKAMSDNSLQRVPTIFVLILCPTRELASQIAAETNALLKYHKGIGVQTLVGGTRFKDDQKRLESSPSQIVVATPGRLLDHVENKSGLSVQLMGLKMLILDEAGHLLDLGFRKDIEKIVDCLPRQRQSLLFTATIPKEVRRISQLVLKREHALIDTVGLGCVETLSQVKQSYLVAPHELHFQMVHHLLTKHISKTPDYKVIVFCTTAMVTSLMYLLLREMKLNVREMHTRKPQLSRTRISEEFKESKRLILVTSDVSSRGMNYPDVTLVIQVGIPLSRNQYIHRLGRTGREGKEGEGMLILAPWEEYFLGELKDIPLENFTLPHLDANAKLKMEDSMAKVDGSVKESAYHAWLGYYNSIKEIGRDKTTLVEAANKFSESIGLQKPPALFRKTAVKMGLRDIPGIRIHK